MLVSTSVSNPYLVVKQPCGLGIFSEGLPQRESNSRRTVPLATCIPKPTGKTGAITSNV